MDLDVKVIHQLIGIRRLVTPGVTSATNLLDKIRDLEPAEFDVLMKAIAHLRQYASRQSVRLMMQRNYMALRQLLEEAAQEFAATQKPPDHLAANGGAELNRHLLGFPISEFGLCSCGFLVHPL